MQVLELIIVLYLLGFSLVIGDISLFMPLEVLKTLIQEFSIFA